MFKLIFEILTDPLGLPIEWYWEYLILTVIGAVAYAVAYRCVGDMYSGGMIDGSTSGSFFHWLIRLILFVVLWAVTYGIIAVVKWLTDNWVLVLCIMGGVVAVVGIAAVIAIIIRKRKIKRDWRYQLMRATKDSGISWLGEYPSDWELKKIKYCLQERVEKNNPVRTTEILSLTAKQGVIPYDQKEGGGNKPKEDVSAYRLAYPGDIVMNSMNILSGSVGLSQYFGCVSPVYYMLRPWKVTEDVRYYNYTFQTTMFQRSLFGLGNGILIKESGNGKLNTIRMRIPMDKFGELFIPVAPIDEQQRIADFLDAKCAKIDALVADIQSQIDTLEQYKRSVITETVTKGLNPDAEMKDSGVQWIGDTPAHWGVIRGKYILRYMQKPVRENDGVITCFRDGEVTLRSNRREDGFTMSDKEIGYQGIDVGDLVVHGMDGFAGAIGISDSRGKASPVLNVLDTDQCKRYIMYYLRSMAYSDVFLALATGIRVRSCDLRWNKLAELSYPVPPLDEQNAIVKHIDSVLSKADAVIADKKHSLQHSTNT